MYPTLADLAGLKAPAQLEGRSLRPLLADPGAPWDRPALTQVQRGAGDRAFMGYSLRTEQWRYTEWDQGNHGVELYRPADDPRETRNLASDPKYREAVAELQQRLAHTRGIGHHRE